MKSSPDAPRAHAQSSAANSRSLALRGAFASLHPKLQRAVSERGYTTPTPIQERCISPLLDGHDLIGSAQTGTGKTAGFALPLLQRLANHNQRPRSGTPRALILAPTRELAAQIGDSIAAYGRHLKTTHTTVFGGVNQTPQVKALNRGVDILIATPGRLLDLMNQGHIHLEAVEVFVLDEVDRMLDMGFIPDIKRVLTKLPTNRQTAFFSATLSDKMEELANTMVSNPVRVTIAPEKPTVDGIDQRVLFVDKHKKDDLLLSLLSGTDVSKVLVFIQMKHAANRLVKKLDSAGIDSAAIHGNKSQAARTKALAGFKKGRFRILVATDVAARGLDVHDITHVINYDLPLESETYVHRIGRTGRAGADGDAISFCTAEDRACLTAIERHLNAEVPVDESHNYHCEKARRSTLPAPKPGGGKRAGGKSSRPHGRANGPRRDRRGSNARSGSRRYA